jgi:hypothetical protein
VLRNHFVEMYRHAIARALGRWPPVSSNSMGLTIDSRVSKYSPLFSGFTDAFCIALCMPELCQKGKTLHTRSGDDKPYRVKH